ncbi:MAG: DUF1232 domain-containing protein [Thermomicrobiales bacterium]|nr:DUF1232 domain-containing protein [Thermomicrobiales bacterium]
MRTFLLYSRQLRHMMESRMHRARFDEHLQTFERARLTWRLLRDPRVSTWSKALLPIVAAAYVLLPIDLIPDVLLGLGQVDDASIIGIAIFAMTKLLPRFAPANVVAEHLAQMRDRRRDRGVAQPNVIDADFTVIDSSATRRHERQATRESPT